MGKLVGICVVLFMLAVGVLIVTGGPDLAALFAALRAAPLLEKVAWTVIVLVPLVLLPSAVWLCDTLVRQRKAAQALELRLDGVRQGAKDLAKSQIDADAAVHHLARTDPESAIGAVQQRLTEAERMAQVQQQRNETGDLQSRVDAIRGQQQALKERLGPVLENRRAIERLFLELDTSQNDVERALAEIASGDDAMALDLRLKKLTEFVRQCHDRCDGIEAASKTVSSLQDAYAELHTRLAPFAAAKGGVTDRVKELSEARDVLAADIDTLQRTPQGPLAERVKGFVDDRARLDDGVVQLNTQFSKLATLHDDIDGLMEKLENALGIISPDADGKADIDARIKDVSTFVATTQDELKDIEDRLAVFGQLKAKLAELQSRLVPLEAGDGGVLSLIAQVQDIRDKLALRIARLEAGEGGDLAERVKIFTDAKRELEERVSVVTDHFSKLATVRKDLAGLFEKLSSAANTSN
jgi:chromosome segregation ATPase